jgi:predicted Zn-dependent protease
MVGAAQRTSGSCFEAKLKFMEEIGRMDSAALAGLIRSASGALDVPRMNSFEFRFAVARLVELEPRKAAALWAENGLLRVYGSLSLEGWIKKDPQDFASWARESTHDIGGGARSAIRAFAADNPEKFAELAAQLSTSPITTEGARAAIDRMLAREPDSPEKALAYARALPEGEARNTALFAMLKWPGTNLWSDPEVAGALAQAAPEQAWRLGIETAAGGSPEKLPPGHARQSAFQFSVQSDAFKDPDAAAKRLESLAGTADYAPAVRGFVDALAARDPAAAA